MLTKKKKKKHVVEDECIFDNKALFDNWAMNAPYLPNY